MGMKRAEVILDLLNDRARIKGMWVDLIVSTCNFYGVHMLPAIELGRGIAVDLKKKMAVDLKKKMVNKEVGKDELVSVSMLAEAKEIKMELKNMNEKCLKKMVEEIKSTNEELIDKLRLEQGSASI